MTQAGKLRALLRQDGMIVAPAPMTASPPG